MLDSYQALSKTVIINKNNRLISYDDSLELTGTGRSAFVFKIKSSDKAMKLFFPTFSDFAREEAEIYEMLQGIDYYPTIYEVGANYIVMDYVEGLTLFQCMSHGVIVTSDHLTAIDYALSLAVKLGLNPSDIHLRNIFIMPTGAIKIIDVTRFRQTKACSQWTNLKQAYEQFYRKRWFPKRIPAFLLNSIACLYKRGLIPYYRT